MLSARRAELMEVAANETGKTVAEGDVEVSEAIDFANWYAHLAEELDAVDGARFVPERLTLVTPPWNFPIAIPAGSTLAALAAGSSVVIKPAGQARRCGAVMVQALWDAGVPRDVLTLVDVDEGDLGRHLVSHPSVDRVVLTGAFETAQLFTSWRNDLPLLAETSGKNSIIVTPSADLDLAASDVIKSAFGHAGQKCSAASLVILVGSVATSERFRRQLVDAASTLRVGLPSDPTTQMGPIVEPAHGKLERALTTLGAGESWLVEPRQLDETGRLWSPGVRTGVAAGSEFHLTEYFGPVLGIMTAATLDEAIALQNATDYGLTAGLHTLDPAVRP
jgi:RHH-type proline utilization regulon transcriptional repressor/proline dehydrogenase/delta 1-pyrroline-5-carboxylate dehydrogenase